MSFGKVLVFGRVFGVRAFGQADAYGPAKGFGKVISDVWFG